MTKPISILILALTCATLHAQSVIVKGTGAGAVRGTIAQTQTSVLTNLSVTGTLNPDVSGVYTQIADIASYSAWHSDKPWTNEFYNVFTFYIRHGNNDANYYITLKTAIIPPRSSPDWVNTNGVPTGQFTAGGGVAGTAAVAYWYQTNYSSGVTIRGKATP